MNLRRAGVIATILFVMVLAGILIWRFSFVARDGARYFVVNDDALISLRYAWNLAHGNGLVWNAGERIEGFTNPLWTLYATVWATLTPRRLLPLVIQVSGVLCLLAQCFLLRRTARILWKREGLASRFGEAMAFLLPVAYYPLVYWSIGGLEVCAVGALFSWALLLHIQGRFTACCLVLGAAYWTRPDSLVPGALILAVAWHDARTGRLPCHAWVRGACALAGCIVLLLSLRLLYYGDFWPNTYVLKLGQFHLLDRLRLNALGYLQPFLCENLPILIVAMASLAVKPTSYKFLLAAPAILMTVYAAGVGGDALPYWRFMAPFMPALGLVAMLELPCPAQQFRPVWMAGFAVGLTAWTVASFGCYRILLRGPALIERRNIETALVLNTILKPGATTGVFHAGAIPYYTDFQAVDFLGKCDRKIAQLKPHLGDGAPQWAGMRSVPGHNKYDLAYSIGALSPTFVQGFFWWDDNFSEYVKENYVGIPVPFRTHFTGPWLFLRRNSPYVDWSVASNSVSMLNKR